MAFAGLWECRREPEAGDIMQTFTITTGPPNKLVAPIHNRIPVILPRDAWCRWLGEDEAGVDDLNGMLRPFPAELKRAYPLAKRVGSFATMNRICWRRWRLEPYRRFRSKSTPTSI